MMVILVAASLIAAIWLLNAFILRPGIENIGKMHDYVNIQLYIEKDNNPDLYPSDYIYADKDCTNHYTPSYRLLLSALIYVTGNFGNALIVLVPLLSFVYTVAMTLFLRQFTSSLPIAIFIAAISSIPHFSPGYTFWGIGGIYSVMPRSVFTSVAPLLLLVHLHCSGNVRGSALSLLFVGLATNLHPVSGAIFAQLFIAERTLAALQCRFPWKGILLSIVCFVLGALPFMLPFFISIMKFGGSDVFIDPSSFYSALLIRFNGNLLPLRADMIWIFAESLIPLLLFAAYGIYSIKNNPSQKHNISMMLRLLVVLIVVAVLGHYILQILARKFGWSLMVVDQIRSLRFVYPLCFALATFGLDNIRIRLPRLLSTPTTICIAFILFPLISLPSFTLTRNYWPRPLSSLYFLLTIQTDEIRQEFKPPIAKPQTLALKDVAKWAKENSSHDNLFMCDDARFRLFSQRSIAFSFKDGGTCYNLGKKMFMEWSRREVLVRNARDSKSIEAWIKLAQDLKCDFAVIDKTSLDAPIISNVVYQNELYAIIPVKKFAHSTINKLYN